MHKTHCVYKNECQKEVIYLTCQVEWDFKMLKVKIYAKQGGLIFFELGPKIDHWGSVLYIILELYPVSFQMPI